MVASNTKHDKSAVVVLLNKGKHASAEQEHSFPPVLEFSVPVVWRRRRLRRLTTAVGIRTAGTGGAAPWRCLVFYPHRGQRLLDMLEVEKEAEDELIPEYSFP